MEPQQESTDDEKSKLDEEMYAEYGDDEDGVEEESFCGPMELQQESTDDEKSEYAEYEFGDDESGHDAEEVEKLRMWGELAEMENVPLSEDQERRIEDARDYVANLEKWRTERDDEVPVEQEIEELRTIAIHRWYIEHPQWTKWKRGPYYEYFKECDM
ncbi:hypothetical protein L596_011919 [Steinernema carpocapsae]|nr:hypothetical protein L596_011919 [Steinernema carpocapsae]